MGISATQCVLCTFLSARPRKSQGLFWKMFLGVAVGVPVVVGVQYALAEPRERRKMKILVKGVGRFCRWVSSFMHVVKCFE